ncbi:MAG: hypothetical protein JXM69_21490 [Anaerolineae bacterium]|nr:hypothetical protein [Anaerolineae bacterium]
MMESAITLLAVTGFAVVLAAVSGFLLEKWEGAAILGGLVLLASAFHLAGAFLGYYYLGGYLAAWVGLLMGIGLGGLILAVSFRNATQGKRAGSFAAGMWFGFWFLCFLGYAAGRWVGLLLLTVPAIFFFLWGLYRTSARILPLRDLRNTTALRKAFRALVTYSMGTNYPYYFVDEDSRPEKRVDGNPYLKILAGPGLVCTDANHIPYVTSGLRGGQVFEPGLTFTGIYDLEPRIIDLRPQLRAFPVEALTKDGIPIKVTTFCPCRIDPGDETPALGRAFPFRPEAVHKVLAGERVERKTNEKESGGRHDWMGGPQDGLVPLMATPIVQDIISRYTIDELCEPHNPARDPRVEIAAEMRKRVGETLAPLGLKLIGGGIGNLVPENDKIIERRLENWWTKWEGQILEEISEAQATRMYITKRARAKVEAEIFDLFRRSTKKLDLALALRFVDTLGDIFAESSQWPLLNDELDASLKRLRGESVEEKKGNRLFLDLE